MLIHDSKYKAFEYLPSLDGLRAISIILVLYDHIVIISGKNIFPEFLQVFINGKSGVDLFFLISGFLITSILLKEYSSVGKIDLKRFYIRRSFRIFPAYYFLLLVYFIMQYLDLVYINKSTWISSIFYLRQFFGSGWLTAHFWSLSVEEIFYILFPPILIHSLKSRKQWLSSVFLFLFLFGLPISRFLILEFDLKISPLSFFFRGEAILVGVFIGLNREWLLSSILKFRSIWILLFLLGILSIYSELLMGLKFVELKYILNLFLPQIKVVFFALLFIIILNLKKGFIYYVLNSRIFVFVGLISYSIYLWQQVYFSKIINDLNINIILRVICIFLTSLVSFYFIEKPINRLKNKF